MGCYTQKFAQTGLKAQFLPIGYDFCFKFRLLRRSQYNFKDTHSLMLVQL
jgi:hypothetical protein